MARVRRRTSGPGRAGVDRWAVGRALSAGVALAVVLLRLGWPEPVLATGWLVAGEWAALAGFAVSLLAPRLREAGLIGALRRSPVRAMFLVLAGVSVWSPVMVTVSVSALAVTEFLDGFVRIVSRTRSTGLVFVGSFAVLILAGTLALLLPVATPAGAPISVVDAAFTATSAVCVTGLVVRDTGTAFSDAGQWIILGLMQLGGLGIVIFGALIALTMGSAMGLRLTRTLSAATAEGQARPSAVRPLVLFIVGVTLAVEAVGAGLLYVGWPGVWPGEGGPDIADPVARGFHAVFFSVSAFCNAGFATAGTSLESLRFHWTSHVVMAGLITLGGIGFPVLDNLRAVLWAKVSGRRTEQGALVRLSLHTRLVLAASVTLYALGAIAVAVGRMSQGGQPIGSALLDGHFMSVTARTAGFDTIAPGSMGPLSRLTLITLMFVGGSPGSAAGGVKTVAVAIIVLTIWSTIRGRGTTTAFGREIGDALVRRAATLITLGAATIAVLTLALALTDGQGRLLGDLLFEVVSASSTVGLSTGITGDLSPAGRVVLIVAMFLGRVGPLVVLGALVSVGRQRRPSREFPTEPVVMG